MGLPTRIQCNPLTTRTLSAMGIHMPLSLGDDVLAEMAEEAKIGATEGGAPPCRLERGESSSSAKCRLDDSLKKLKVAVVDRFD
ncbi:hypothetical protein LINPERHAP2_LOCUS399 [Linum perenne]